MAAMFVQVQEALSGFGSAWLPAGAVGLATIFAVGACLVGFFRADAASTGERLLRSALIVLLAAIGYALVDHSFRREASAERQALEARGFDLAARAFVPGSPLSCLAGPVGEAVEEACETTLFATPETVAAAVSYVAAQLALLADARDQVRRGGNYGSALTNLRRTLEADRFGIVAHVLEARDGCTSKQCAAFGFLQGTGRVSANLVDRPFEAHLKNHMAGWQNGSARSVAGTSAPPPAPAISAARPASGAYFPSSSSIPQVNIMAAEPPSSPSREAAAAGAEASRKPNSTTPPTTRQPSSAGGGAITSAAPVTGGPLQLAPHMP
jgi:hypothetical protein